MFDEKTIQEVAKATNTALDIAKGTGGFLDDVFGRTLRQLGAIPERWAYLLRVRCVLSVAEKLGRITSRIFPNAGGFITSTYTFGTSSTAKNSAIEFNQRQVDA